MAHLISLLRWLGYNLAPVTCPDCTGFLSLVMRRTAVEIGAMLPPADERRTIRSDWLCCEDCDYAMALDIREPRPAAGE